MTPAAFGTSKAQDYSTPWRLVDAIEEAIGKRFTLDVCASAKSAKAPKFYTEEMDAFRQDWAADAGNGAAWCNPPYADGWPAAFLTSAGNRSWREGLTTVFLLPANKTDQAWWHDMVIPFHAVWDVRGRVDFLDPETGEVPKVWKYKPEYADQTGFTDLIGDLDFGKWVKQSNPQASKIVIVGPEFPPCLPRSFSWK